MLMVHVDLYFDCECFVVDGAVVVVVAVEIFVAVVLVAVVSSVFIDAIRQWVFNSIFLRRIYFCRRWCRSHP